MNIVELHKFLDQWRKLQFFPSASGWPESLSLTSTIWDKLKDIQKYTLGDGHEYAVSIFTIDGDSFVSPYVRGTRENVVTRSAVQVSYEPKDKNYYEKKVISNGKVVKKEIVSVNRVPKKVEISYLFNVHTHPIQSDTYSFFSGMDIKSFLGSSAIVMGLLTDKLWLVSKTDKSLKVLGENGEDVLMEISREIFSHKEDEESLIKAMLANWGLVFYCGAIGSSLKKIK